MPGWSVVKNQSTDIAVAAPSWSWASVDVEVSTLPCVLSCDRASLALVEVVSISVEPKGIDVFGALRSGELRLKGSCYKFHEIEKRKERSDFFECSLDEGQLTKLEMATYLPLSLSSSVFSLRVFKIELGSSLKSTKAPSETADDTSRRLRAASFLAVVKATF